MTDQEQEIAQRTVEELMEYLTIEGECSLSGLDEGFEAVLETQDSGLVIGYHGEVLEAFQLILTLCISRKLGRFVRVSLEVGDYKKNRTGWIENLALSAKEQAIVEKREVPLPHLKAWERRIVHLLLQNDDAVYSESVGEGRERTLVIRPR